MSVFLKSLISVVCICKYVYMKSMEVSGFYKCMSDPQRIRILALLVEGPLCVCHLAEILEMDQVRLSKQLRYLKDQGTVTAERQAQWMIYRVAEPVVVLLSENLEQLRELDGVELPLNLDGVKREHLAERISKGESGCSSEVQELLVSFGKEAV